MKRVGFLKTLVFVKNKSKKNTKLPITAILIVVIISNEVPKKISVVIEINPVKSKLNKGRPIVTAMNPIINNSEVSNALLILYI